MPIKKWLKPYARSTEATKEVRPRLAIIEEIIMLTSPKWNWKKFVKPMTITEACEKVWISSFTWRAWRQEDKKIGEYVDNMRIAHKEMAHDMMQQYAMDNVMEGVSWAVKLRPMDKINLSMRYLEKTSPEFNPALKVESWNTTNIQINMGSEEMQQRVLELASALWITNLQNYAKWTILPTTLPTINNEEQTWTSETTSETTGGWVIEASWSEWLEES